MEMTIGKTVIRDLGDGLVMRHATLGDAEALANFNARIHSDDDPPTFDATVYDWTLDLLSGTHPTFQPGDFTIVEKVATGEIVSSLNLISQTWRYAGVPFGVGRPELVGTHPDYRNRGLVRAQFDVIHRWSALRGEKVQAITGIPYYYRQFGYEMALDLAGGRILHLSDLPPLPEGQPEPYRLRPATAADLPLILPLYEQKCRRSLISCVRDEKMFRYEMDGRRENNGHRALVRVIETPEGQPVGYIEHPARNWGARMTLFSIEVTESASYQAVLPSVLRYLLAFGRESTARLKGPEISILTLNLGGDHPAYAVYPVGLATQRRPYAWYLRVADLPDFVRHIAPALETRLASSAFSGYTGDLKLSFYRKGLRMAFEGGRLASAEAWNPEPRADSGDAGFPNLTFLQLLFGYRSLDDLTYAFADCFYNSDRAAGLLNALFPKQPSNVWAVA